MPAPMPLLPTKVVGGGNCGEGGGGTTGDAAGQLRGGSGAGATGCAVTSDWGEVGAGARCRSLLSRGGRGELREGGGGTTGNAAGQLRGGSGAGGTRCAPPL